MIKRFLSIKGLKEVACFVMIQEGLDTWVMSGGLGADEMKNELGEYNI